MGRIEEVIAHAGVGEMLGPCDAWDAAAIVTRRFPGDEHGVVPRPLVRVGNWFRLSFLSRAITNRDRTVVIGIGGTRPVAVLAAAGAAAWLAPRLPRAVVAGVAGVTIAMTLRHRRLQRIWWSQRRLRQHAPGALLIGDFAAREPGAGIRFASEMIDALAADVSLALTVQGPRASRRVRSLVRLYERQLRFEVVDRQSVADDEMVFMVRHAAMSAPPAAVASS
jgi:hypothetical protein